jgi:aminocarboxymuconate-semialdehyde decarboxylase
MDLIDIHSHLYPRWYVEALKRRSELPKVVGREGEERFVIFEGEEGRPMSPAFWQLDEKLAFMDATGIAVTVVSLGNPWLDPFEAAVAGEVADEANAYFAGLERATGGRVVGLGVLPQHEVAAAVETVQEIARTPTLYGVINGTRICGRELADSTLDPVWAVLEREQLPFFIHPHYVVGRDELRGFGHAFPVAVGFPFETTVAVARLVFAGVLQRYPALKLVAAHGGGTIPFLAGRLAAGWKSDPSTHDRLDVSPLEDLAKLFLDALVYYPGALAAVAALVGVERMAFGTDHPFSVADPSANLNAIDAVFASSEREAVRSASARRLFGLSS